MLGILTVEPKGVILYIVCKKMFDPVFSAPPLVQMSTSYLLIRQTELIDILHMLILVCIAREVFFFLGECM
ncbi:unnamed protein product [Staurois parvus]|uniref:Uncharacterized protein n=1 Tax=Staurois parvus TaxID=386267 RepID=A0ABN9D7R8_9NEOB|nr:unnamed protein product [Staurois parvus]